MTTMSRKITVYENCKHEGDGRPAQLLTWLASNEDGETYPTAVFEFEDGRVGYVHSAYIRFEKDPPVKTQKPRRVMVIAGGEQRGGQGLLIRWHPTEDAALIEFDDGQTNSVYANRVRFLDKGEEGETKP